MNKLKLAKTLSVLLLTFCAANSAQAVPFSDLLQPGGSITAADKVFDQWEVTFQDSSDPGFVYNFADINVNPLNDGGDHPGPGINITFGEQMRVTGDDIYAYKDLTIDFHVSTLGDKLIEDNSLNFGNPLLGTFLSYASDGSNDLGVVVEEWVYDVLGSELAHKYIEFSNLDGILTSLYPDVAQFTPQQEIFVKKNILVWSRDVGDTAGLGGIEQRFSQVPEPALLLLLSAGLVATGYSKRRQI